MRVVKTKQMVPRARDPLEGGLPTPANLVANGWVAPIPHSPGGRATDEIDPSAVVRFCSQQSQIEASSLLQGIRDRPSNRSLKRPRIDRERGVSANEAA